jgi:glycerophosphoryl diester phosphodiesterase
MMERCVAHRGMPHKYPENTLSSFLAAARLGCKRLELDINMSKDGVPMVIHDSTIDRTTNGRGAVKAYTAAELQQFRIDGTERIPTLEETLRTLKGGMFIHIELKQEGDLYPGMEERVVEVIKRTVTQDQVMISSFDHYSLIRTRRIDTNVQLGFILYGSTPAIIPLAKELRVEYVAFHHVFNTDEFLSDCKEHGLLPIVWTVNDEETLKRYVKDARVLVCADEVERWAELAGESTLVDSI